MAGYNMAMDYVAEAARLQADPRFREAAWNRARMMLDCYASNPRACRHLADLGQAWRRAGLRACRPLGIETNPQTLQVTSPNEVMVVATFRLRLGPVTGPLALAYPYPMLEPVLPRLGSQATTTDGAAAPERRASRVRPRRPARDDLPAWGLLSVVANVNLPGESGGDEARAVFSQHIYVSSDLGREPTDLLGFPADFFKQAPLFIRGWNWNLETTQVIPRDLQCAVRCSGQALNLRTNNTTVQRKHQVIRDRFRFRLEPNQYVWIDAVLRVISDDAARSHK